MTTETPNTEATMQQIRENMNKQLAAVKAQLEQAMEQSLQAVNEAVNHTMQKLVKLMPTADATAEAANAIPPENKENEPSNTSHDAALQAMKIAEDNIRNAMTAAEQSILSSQEMMKHL